MKTYYFAFFLLLLGQTSATSQCSDEPGIIYQTNAETITLEKLARITAPMFWFSPDEQKLYDTQGNIQLPQRFPYDDNRSGPVVYYKVKKLYTELKELGIRASEIENSRTTSVPLKEVAAIELEFFHYYEEETGLSQHDHDIEAVVMQLQIIKDLNCREFKYAIQVKRVIARAHGLYWFENALNVDHFTSFPISILVEEGKHASCTDKNADGAYTPGFDVTEKVNDAWGVRDIIHSGKLYTGGFQAWMAKVRAPKSLLLPPESENSVSVNKIKERFPNAKLNQFYQLAPYPKVPDDYSDKTLRKLALSKKPIEWPLVVTRVNAANSITKLSKDHKLRNKIGVTVRFDEESSLALSLPFLLVTHLEAPITGGWITHKIYLGPPDATPENYGRKFGHQLIHSNSASRWIDTYVGLGYEIVDRNPEIGVMQFDPMFVSEIGMKIRWNIRKTPLKFLKFLGTDYWGVSLGWKNVGFSPFFYSGFVLQVGVGAF